MSDRNLADLSKEELIQHLQKLHREVKHLRQVKIAFDAQDELVRSLVSMGRAATGRLMLRSMLLQTSKVSVQLTDATESSLFLLDGEGKVTESVLARGATIREQRDDLIGTVLDQGLAGWVVRQRQVGLIQDTRQDDRWVTLPDQPYSVGSALCVPILRGKVLLGILTLTHPQPNHFTATTAELMKMCATQMALALDNARLYMIERDQQEQLENIQSATTPQTSATATSVLPPDLSQIGIYIIGDKGKFLYANTQVADIFGYEFGELVALESILKLVATKDYHRMAETLQQCFQGTHSTLACHFQGQRKDRQVAEIQLHGKRTKFSGRYVIIGVLGLA
ncbi:GAF domain-containing protein [Spirulina sp. CS-785/01]|uniref:GAF domain-containing protein n=1 Tax=Spirulina sp. CS-785/01 TaxID=3021716 RepID=UPI00232C7E28|nr:GAF domain-containing protein [Spirulina sp. CS-785/01]MDB9311976.1 GAF domain-containing protein [Spirulina sp. CS-785/01]